MSIVRKYRSLVVSIQNEISGVYKVKFSSPDKPFRYSPGQFLHLALDIEYDGSLQWPESRCFSMQSNPDEKNLQITYAVKGRFTRMMEEKMKVGSAVWLKLPYGDLFTSPHNKVNTVFIAGGTGITPFLSLFTHKSFNNYINPRIYLGFRNASYNIYKRDLGPVQFSGLKIFYEDVEGRLDIQKIFKENGISSDYFISGPPDMIKSFKSYLITSGVSATQVKTDDWE